MEARALLTAIAASLAWTANVSAQDQQLRMHGISETVRLLATFPRPADSQVPDRGLRPLASRHAAAGFNSAGLQAPSPARRPLAFVNTGGVSVNIEGLPAAAGSVSGAVGDFQYVQTAGGDMAIYRKDNGARVLGPFSVKAMFFDAEPGAPMTACRSQPVRDASIHHDRLARRWIVRFTASSTDGSARYQCIAVSTGADAGGSYYRYALELKGNGARALYVDDPKMALWPHVYYMSFSLFDSAPENYRGPRICSINRRAMINGLNAALRCVDLGNAYGPLSPAAFEGDSSAPGAARPGLFLSLAAGGAASASRLYLWRFPAFRRARARPFALDVAPFSTVCLEPDGRCIAQPAPGAALPMAGDRIAPGAVYRHFGGRDVLAANHSVVLADGRAGVRWYAIGDVFGKPYAIGQGTIGGGTESRWMGSVGMDQAGNIALGYNVAAADTPPGIRYTGRAPADPPGMMQTEEVIVNGTGSPTGLAALRFSGTMSLDPADGCTFWYTQRYVPVTGPDTWRTRIARFSFRSCH